MSAFQIFCLCGLFILILDVAVVVRRLATISAQLEAIQRELIPLIKAADKIQESLFNIETNQPL